jgi:hypothetical protein
MIARVGLQIITRCLGLSGILQKEEAGLLPVPRQKMFPAVPINNNINKF